MTKISKTLEVDQNAVLGKASDYSSEYSADLLYAIARQSYRDDCRNDPKLLNQCYGVDIWNCYEVSWLDRLGKPHVAALQIRVPCQSKHIVESKSLKLYLNSLNNKHFENPTQLVQLLEQDLHTRFDCELELISRTESENLAISMRDEKALLIDKLDVDCQYYQVRPELLETQDHCVEETLYSELLRSNCPVTNQPDWGDIVISYTGPQIQHESLLRYIVSYREHNGFHEQTVEQIYSDLMTYCKPEKLSVSAHYTRRGGIDINPSRSSYPIETTFKRVWRQ